MSGPEGWSFAPTTIAVRMSPPPLSCMAASTSAILDWIDARPGSRLCRYGRRQQCAPPATAPESVSYWQRRCFDPCLILITSTRRDALGYGVNNDKADGYAEAFLRGSHRHDDYVDEVRVKQIDKVACNGDRQIGIAVARRVCGSRRRCRSARSSAHRQRRRAPYAEFAPLCNTIGAGMNRSVEQQARLD